MPSEVMKSLLMEQYTVDDVRKSRDPMVYVQAVIRHAKSAELPQDSQVLFAWRNLNSTLQMNVPKPAITTTEAQFADTLPEWKKYGSGITCGLPTTIGYSKAPGPTRIDSGQSTSMLDRGYEARGVNSLVRTSCSSSLVLGRPVLP